MPAPATMAALSSIPAGDFVVGTIELKSYVTLHVAAAGRLLGSGKPEHYSAGKGVPPGNGNVVLLYAVDADNVTVEGRGTIDGHGDLFYTGKGDNTGPGGNRAEGYVARPHLAIFYRCRNLLVRDVFFTRSAYHCMRILECRYVRLDGVRIYNRVNLNNDGFHINSSQYVNIVNCNVACQDDACALFGSNRFVTVTNSTFSTRWSIFRFGNGQAENIAISNCVIYETYGCAIKIRIGGGARIEDVSFSNLVMRDVTGPISIGLDSSRRTNAAAPKGVVRGLSFNGIRATVVSKAASTPTCPSATISVPAKPAPASRSTAWATSTWKASASRTSTSPTAAAERPKKPRAATCPKWPASTSSSAPSPPTDSTRATCAACRSRTCASKWPRPTSGPPWCSTTFRTPRSTVSARKAIPPPKRCSASMIRATCCSPAAGCSLPPPRFCASKARATTASPSTAAISPKPPNRSTLSKAPNLRL